MVDANSTAGPKPANYRVDVVRCEQGDVYQVMRCEPIAQFDNEQHAAFLVELLKGGSNA